MAGRRVDAAEPANATASRRRLANSEGTMGLIILLVVGGIVGWLAGLIMRDNNGVILNVVVGIVGAVLAGFVITPLIGGAPITSGVISIQSIIVSLLGAIVLLAIINLFRRGAVR
jgi:uncharacterized membrane protein YeaQ/YmgE (transglycosylase-associated protein family)